MIHVEFPEHTQQPSRGEAFVLLAGLATTAVTMLFVWLVTTEDFNPMGWYVLFILPVGAMLVGALAGSGYCLAAWLRGVKLGGWLLFGVLILQVGAYFAGQYFEYRALVPKGAAMSFWEYFDFTTRAFAFKGRGGGQGAAMGVWGYAFRLLEIAGFALGGVIVVAILAQKPYCDRCRRYMRTKEQMLLPAGIKPRKVSKKDAEAKQAYEAECLQAYESGLKELEVVVSLAQENKAAEFLSVKTRRAAERNATDDLTVRFKIDLQYCPQCSQGTLAVAAVSGQGETMQNEKLAEADVQPEFVQRCVHV